MTHGPDLTQPRHDEHRATVATLLARIDAGIHRHPWTPSWLHGTADDGVLVRAEYERGHTGADYLDACRRRDVREQTRASGARFLRLARALPPRQRREVLAACCA